jgi:hypothetical protein
MDVLRPLDALTPSKEEELEVDKVGSPQSAKSTSSAGQVTHKRNHSSTLCSNAFVMSIGVMSIGVMSIDEDVS